MITFFALYQMTKEDRFLFGRKIPLERRFQQIHRARIGHDSFSNAITLPRKRARTRNFAALTAPSCIPNFLAASAAEFPRTAVSQNACHVGGRTSPRTCSAAR